MLGPSIDLLKRSYLLRRLPLRVDLDAIRFFTDSTGQSHYKRSYNVFSTTLSIRVLTKLLCRSLCTIVCNTTTLSRISSLTTRSIVSAPFDFPKEEEKVIKFWREIDAFQTSLKLSEGRPEYSFYDGPPFATGLPHYGHLLAGTIKVRTVADDLEILAHKAACCRIL